MKKVLRVYADTSVFGGVHDLLFTDNSLSFFSSVREGRFQLVVSALIEKELRHAPEAVRTVFEDVVPFADTVTDEAEALSLQQAYIQSGIISQKWADDALHVAFATVSDCELIVSWNFKHIVNLRRIHLYNAVNMLHGYREIEIRSPAEIVEYDDENDD